MRSREENPFSDGSMLASLNLGASLADVRSETIGFVIRILATVSIRKNKRQMHSMI